MHFFSGVLNKKNHFLVAILDAILSFNMMNLHPDLTPRPESLPIVFKIKPSNFFSGGGGTKIVFCPLGYCTIGFHQFIKTFFGNH